MRLASYFSVVRAIALVLALLVCYQLRTEASEPTKTFVFKHQPVEKAPTPEKISPSEKSTSAENTDTFVFNDVRVPVETFVYSSDEMAAHPVYYLSQYVQASQTSQNGDKQEKKGKRKREKQQANGTPADGDKQTKTDKPGQTTPPAVENQANEVTISAGDQRRDGDTFIATGYVVITFGLSKLQADKVIYNEVSGEAVAEGNVIYDPDKDQRITAQRATINILTKKGTFYEATGFTDQTADGATLNFVAERVEKTSDTSYQLYGAQVTACEQATPAWQFASERATIKVNDYATINKSVFRFKNIPIFYLPAARLPIGKRERKSGFLIPTTGSSTNKGRFFQTAYYQTLGRSADILLRNDIYSKRGPGFGFTFRVRPDELSYLKIGTFSVKDRTFGDQDLPGQRDEGGTLFFAKGVQYLPHGFFVAVDVDFTTNLAFRRVFANEVEQIFNPEKRSQLYVQNNFTSGGSNYTFNILAEAKSDKLSKANQLTINGPNSRKPNVTVRHLPSFELVGYGQQIGKLPLYLSFDTSAELLYRRERLNQITTFITPKTVQRFDMVPKLTLVVPDIAGWSIRPEFRLRSTYYTDSLAPLPLGSSSNFRGTLSPENMFRKYTDVAVEVRPPSLARTYNNEDGSPKFKHLIEPTVTYRKITGIDDFDRTIRFDVRDAVADTNELEYGVTNRFFVPHTGLDGTVTTQEVLSIGVTQKYFFDPRFGGALRDGARNQFFPINTLSGFTFGGRERRFSPINFNVRYRPSQALSADFRMDYDTKENTLRNYSISGSLTRHFFTFTERFYHTSAIQIGPNQFEPGTLPGSVLITNINMGNDRRGFYGGGSITYDFTSRLDLKTGQRTRPGFRRSSSYIGYACDCGNIELDLSTVNVNGFNETRFTFSFTLSGVGTFGTDRSK